MTTDLHFTDKPEDSYRFKIFPAILREFKSTGDKNLLILGDLTDAKDHHSAALVNDIVRSLLGLTEAGMELFILKGNHDYIDSDMPFFEFLGQFDYINYIKDPKCFLIEGRQCLFLPHCRNPMAEWKANRFVTKYRKSAELVFCHESVIGSVTSSGYEMQQGLLPSYFRRFKGEVFSGDIHCPQKVGRVTYVGTPYSIRFNDHYRGRMLRITTDSYNGVSLDVRPIYPDIRGRWTLDVVSVEDLRSQLEGLEFLTNDQLKVRFEIDEADEERWDAIRKEIEAECAARSLEISSLHVKRRQLLPLRKRRDSARPAGQTPGEVIDSFADRRGITKAKRNAGRKIVEGE